MIGPPLACFLLLLQFPKFLRGGFRNIEPPPRPGIVIGGRAYASLGAIDHALSPTFAELSAKFGEFVDVLADVSDHTSLAGKQDVLRIYERWVRTGSRRDGDLLVERGVVPNRAIADAARMVQ